jgi:hypothetical protein
VEQAEPAAWVGAEDGGGEAVVPVFGDELVPAAGAVAEVDPEPAFGFSPEAGEDVLATELGLPDVDAPVAPAFLAVLPEHPAVSAAAPSAPAANRTEIRFIEPNLSG